MGLIGAGALNPIAATAFVLSSSRNDLSKKNCYGLHSAVTLTICPWFFPLSRLLMNIYIILLHLFLRATFRNQFALGLDATSGLSIDRSLSFIVFLIFWSSLFRLILHGFLICFLCSYNFYCGEYHYSCMRPTPSTQHFIMVGIYPSAHTHNQRTLLLFLPPAK